MNKASWMLIAAGVVAAAVLAITLMSGPPAPPRGEGLSAEELERLGHNARFDPSESEAGAQDPTLLHTTERGQWVFPDPDTGRVTRIDWQRLTPQSEFAYDMAEPVVRIAFSPARILEIAADGGHFQLNDQQNQLQRGRVAGHVVVRLMETDDGSPVDLETDRDLQLRMTVDEADFDMELGELTSDSVVTVTGPRVEFRGRGLSLSYNRLRNRIDRMVIDRDISLRIKGALPGEAVETASAPSSNAQASAGSTPREATDDVEAPQYYRARFEENVVVDAAQRGAHMTSDYLEAVFTFEGGSPHESPQAAATADRQPRPDRPTAADRQPTSTETAGDVVVTCAGRLVMEPLPDPEPALLADPEAVLLALVGSQQPVRIETGEGETITGARVDYLTTTGRMRAAGEGEVMPMRVRSKIGQLTGRSLVIDPAAAQGSVEGPGTLIAASEGEEAQPLRVAWADRLDLELFVEPRGDGAAHVQAVRTATFMGNARVDHADFDMSAGVLTAHLTREGDTQRLRAIDAADRVRMTGQRDAADQPITIAAERMHVDITTDEHGDEQPTRMTAAGGVEVSVGEPMTRLIGDHMLVDTRARQMELFGSPDEPARAIRRDGELRGEVLVMNETTETIRVPGTGTFTFTRPSEQPGGDAAQLTVTWADSMMFDQSENFAHFVGNVVSVAATSTDETTLACGDLRLDFVEVEGDSDEEMGGRRIELAAASGQPALTSRSFDPANPEDDLTRFRLEGPVMTFEQQPGYQLAQVEGAGRLLVEDYRPRPSQEQTDAVRITGRGQTLFTWDSKLMMDAARNDMLMQGNVKMVHRPMGERPGEFGQVATLVCQKLLADLSESEGMDDLLADDAPKLHVHTIIADRGVQLTQGRRHAEADRLIYTGETDTVELLAARGRRVSIADRDRPTPLTGSAFKWDLNDNTIELMKPGAATVPLPKD